MHFGAADPSTSCGLVQPGGSQSSIPGPPLDRFHAIRVWAAGPSRWRWQQRPGESSIVWPVSVRLSLRPVTWPQIPPSSPLSNAEEHTRFGAVVSGPGGVGRNESLLTVGVQGSHSWFAGCTDARIATSLLGGYGYGGPIESISAVQELTGARTDRVVVDLDRGVLRVRQALQRAGGMLRLGLVK